MGLGMKCCPTCGQTLPPDRTRWAYMFRGRSAKIVEIMQKVGSEGIFSDALFERVYGDDPDGGPDGGVKSMSCLIAAINRRLKTVGKRIRATSRGRGGYHPYVMQDVGARVARWKKK